MISSRPFIKDVLMQKTILKAGLFKCAFENFELIIDDPFLPKSESRNRRDPQLCESRGR